ncbi:AAA family ATPase [Micromonospora chokoriensis]
MSLTTEASPATEAERAALNEYFQPFDFESLAPDEQAEQLAALRMHPMRDDFIEWARQIRAGEVELRQGGDPFEECGAECVHDEPSALLRYDDDVTDAEYERLVDQALAFGAVDCGDGTFWWIDPMGEREAVAKLRRLLGGPPAAEEPHSDPFGSPQYKALLASLFSEDAFDARPPVDWLVDKVLPRGALAYLIGEPGNGKTFVALDLAYSLATGRDWWGHEVAQAGPVLYVAAEDDRGVQARARAWRQRHLGGQATGKVHFLAHAPQVGEPGSFDALGTLVELLRPVLVVLDTQARVTRGLDENDSKAMGELIHQANRLQKLGTAVLSVHHPARGGAVPRGSSAQEGAADVVVFCQMDDDKVLKVKCTKQKNAAEFEPLSLGLDPEGESAVLRTTQPLRWEGEEQIIRWLNELNVPQGAGFTVASRALEGAGHRVTKRALEGALRLRKDRAPVPRVAAPQ